MLSLKYLPPEQETFKIFTLIFNFHPRGNFFHIFEHNLPHTKYIMKKLARNTHREMQAGRTPIIGAAVKFSKMTHPVGSLVYGYI